MVDIEFVVWNETLIPSPLPFFVVIIMTPLDAREPYMAVEDASLRIVMLSMSLGFIKLSSHRFWREEKG